jgi:hypothetical protein
MPSFSALCFLCPLSSCTRSRRWSSPPYTFTSLPATSQVYSAASCSGHTSGKASARWGALTSSRHWRRAGLPATKVGTFTQALYDEAKKNGWIVISLKNDWKVIFPFESK